MIHEHVQNVDCLQLAQAPTHNCIIYTMQLLVCGRKFNDHRAGFQDFLKVDWTTTKA
jgi:hypothetical protein